MLGRKATLFALAVTVFVWLFCDISLADKISLPDDHAPIGVMGDHTHKTAEWMVSYRLINFIRANLNQPR